MSSVIWNEQITTENIPSFIDDVLVQAKETKQQLLVFPGLVHEIYEQDHFTVTDYLLRCSKSFTDLVICPGSFLEKSASGTYHTAYLIQNGEVILKQRQLYLANWERDLGLTRGSDLQFVQLNNMIVALVVSTDTFYPQVIRYAKLSGVDLIISPVAMLDSGNFSRQLSGLWQNVQQNTLYAIESGLKGEFNNEIFNSESIIHAPIELTKNNDGMLVREHDQGNIIHIEIKKESLTNDVIFRPLDQLNINAYKDIF